MPPPNPSDRASVLLMEECYSTGDARFLDALRKVEHPKLLAGLADRWKKDARPWARAQILAYLDQPLDVPGHPPPVNRP